MFDFDFRFALLRSVYQPAFVIPIGPLDDWFISRLLWGLVLGFAFGILISIAHLCRITYRPPYLSINHRARRALLGWVICFAVGAAILLLLDAWRFHSFGNVTLSFSEALSEVWLSYRTIAILGLSSCLFFTGAAITTKVFPKSRCPYAFWSSPRDKI